MSVVPKKVVLTAFLFVVAACTVTEQKSAFVQRQWPAAGIRKLDLNEINGDIDVKAGKSDQITLEARVHYAGMTPTSEENRGFFESSIDGDTLRISSLRRRRGNRSPRIQIPFLSGQSVTVDYQLRVPEITELEIETVNGEINVAGIRARATLNSVNGGVSVESAGVSEVEARTVNGPVKAHFLKDFLGAKVRTVNGPVHVILPANSSFTCDLSQVNGGFESNFPLSIRSSRGNREVTSVVNGGKYLLRIKTVNGEVDLTREGTPAQESITPIEPLAPMPPQFVPVPPVPPAPRAAAPPRARG